jgi:hypothetical protein
MPQIHFYVSKDLASKIKDSANASGVSVSQYVAGVVKENLTADWPEGFFDEVAGGWKGEPIERPPQEKLEERDSLEN